MIADQLPFVSIIIAARNEEKNILNCLQSILKLKYPQDRLDVLIGNDGSEDNTLEVVQNFTRNQSNFQVFDIQFQIQGQKGKANVLAQLVKKARGEFYFFTDADMILSPDCLISLKKFQENKNLGVLGGFTLVNPNHLWAILQSLDWLEALSRIKLASELKIPVTAMGNHLMLSREAYEAVGGYENIPFSLTEDFALYHKIVGKGFDFYQNLDFSSLSFTEATPGLHSLLGQRKRWMRGAMQLPFWLKIPLLLEALWLPVCLIILGLMPMLGVVFIFGFWLIQDFWLLYWLRKIKKIKLGFYLPLYNLYKPLLNFILLCYYFLPLKIHWKGRSYA